MLYFVVRTDVGRDSGQQRVFACCDTFEEAVGFIETSLGHLKGDYKVFEGEQVEEG
jgi:hypothetical protein